MTLNFKMLLTKNTVETESNWPITAKLPHHITSVLQKRGWISLALKVSSLLVAKNHFVFYFFVILKKRKWFLLGAVLIEILGVKAPPSQSRFPMYEIPPNHSPERGLSYIGTAAFQSDVLALRDFVHLTVLQKAKPFAKPPSRCLQ